jgi:GTP:adenosylcobinamide-phosphate guanylyltransferase
MAGIERKALLPVRGIAQIDRVADALDGAGLSRPFAMSGLGEAREGFSTATSGDGPADSAWLALQNADFPVLLTTADHPLLTAEMVTHFIAEAQASGANFCIGLATRETISAAYPETKRTYFKFSDVAISGCNLFWIADRDGLEAIQFWRRAQSYRKRPIKLAAQFGPAMILQYLFGQLSLKGAFAFASRKLGITAAPVLLPFAEAAIDLDKPSDLVLIEQILDARG